MPARLFTLSLALCGLTAGGCLSPTCPAGEEGCVCEAGDLCGDGLLCVADRCEVVACEDDADCAQHAPPCHIAACRPTGCGLTFAPEGSDPAGIVEPEGDCSALRCDGAGQVVAEADPGDVPPSDATCRVWRCEGARPVEGLREAGATCEAGVCDAAGACVACLPGSTRCAGDAVETCDPDHAWSAAEPCARPTPFCADGACGALSPGFVLIEANAFTMGSPPAEVGRGDDEGRVAVTVGRAFELARTEVTQAEWVALSDGANPSESRACGPSCPVENLTWWSALGFANALSAARGFSPCYALPEGDEATDACTGRWQDGTLSCRVAAASVRPEGGHARCDGYRLPSEAEWELAARGGRTTATWLGDLAGGDLLALRDCNVPQPNLDPIAWWSCNTRSDDGAGASQPVATRAPNPLGLHDMLGNVWEWTWDAYLLTLPGRTDPAVDEATGEEGPCRQGARCGRVYRGGGAVNSAEFLRAAARYATPSSNRFDVLGLRLARTLP